jgi:hypothetical protein
MLTGSLIIELATIDLYPQSRMSWSNNGLSIARLQDLLSNAARRDLGNRKICEDGKGRYAIPCKLDQLLSPVLNRISNIDGLTI